MQLRYNYRAYPVASQRRALAKAFGCARVVRNDCLRDRKEAHAAALPYGKSAQLSRLRITRAKRTEERAWLAEVSARRPVRRPEDRQPALPVPGREETQAPPAGAVPQGQGIEEWPGSTSRGDRRDRCHQRVAVIGPCR